VTEHPYAHLMAVKQWADGALCAAIRHNADALGVQDMALLVQVLDHIHVVDSIFQHHLRGARHGFDAARSPVPPAFEPLARAMAELDRWYLDYAEGLSAAALHEPVDFVFTSGKPAQMSRGEILLHVGLHGTYHRGNAGALLQLRGLAPSRDSITDYLEETRA
jgi:uncharacterized damage-inducible protein DinB